MKPTNETNFCRVFELPQTYPEGFCFSGGKPVTVLMVDWFNPWPAGPDDGFELRDTTWEQVAAELRPWLAKKVYVKPGRQYLLVTDFGEAMVFGKEPKP